MSPIEKRRPEIECLHGCPHCGMVHRLPEAPAGSVVRCTRCGGVMRRPGGSDANRLCAAVALAALICYPLGITLPVLRLERMGHVQEASIWSGMIALIESGQMVIGVIVLVCSIVIPVVKLAGLFFLCVRTPAIRRRHQARLYRWIERAGRWGMIDVLLVALLVAAVKLGDLVRITPGPGVVAFTVCVLLSLLAAACFDPHAIWEREERDF